VYRSTRSKTDVRASIRRFEDSFPGQLGCLSTFAHKLEPSAAVKGELHRIDPETYL
jgi:hypothetical protein